VGETGEGKGGRKEKEAPTGGVTVSAAAGKRKEERGGGPLREIERWAVGHLAKRKLRSFFFFSFPFSNSFQNQTFLIQIHSKLFKPFYKIYKPFRPHTSNQKPCIDK
jgi:hypothetical protein